MTPAQMITQFRQWMRLTQEQFADALSVERGTVTRWEGNKVAPDEWLVDALSPHLLPLGNVAFKGSLGSEEARQEVLTSLEAYRGNKRALGASKQAPHPRFAVLVIAMSGGSMSTARKTLRSMGYPSPKDPLWVKT